MEGFIDSSDTSVIHLDGDDSISLPDLVLNP
jgi:hypothetical protein